MHVLSTALSLTVLALARILLNYKKVTSLGTQIGEIKKKSLDLSLATYL